MSVYLVMRYSRASAPSSLALPSCCSPAPPPHLNCRQDIGLLLSNVMRRGPDKTVVSREGRPDRTWCARVGCAGVDTASTTCSPASDPGHQGEHHYFSRLRRPRDIQIYPSLKQCRFCCFVFQFYFTFQIFIFYYI